MLNSAAQVDQLFEDWKQMGLSKENLIIRTGEAELGWPYVWGAVAAQCIPSKREYYANRSSCPAAEAKLIISRCQALASGKSCVGCTYYPNDARVLIDDCQGFVKQLCSRVGITLSGGGCTSMWNNNANWERKGTIDTLPNTVCCVFWQDTSDKSKMSHIGFYIGGGMMIHCSGTVKREKLSAKCTHWAIPKGLSDSGDTPMPTYRTIRNGDRGEDVRICQQDLMALGYYVGSTGADGIYGKNTTAAVKEFQKNSGLTVDGICGPRTWEALLKAMEKEPQKPAEDFYTLTIPHLTIEQANALIAQYPDATKAIEGK